MTKCYLEIKAEIDIAKREWNLTEQKCFENLDQDKKDHIEFLQRDIEYGLCVMQTALDDCHTTIRKYPVISYLLLDELYKVVELKLKQIHNNYQRGLDIFNN